MTDTNVGGYIVTTGGYYHIAKVSLTDGTEGEVQILDISGSLVSLGEHCQGQVLLELHPQLATGSILTSMKITDPKGGVVAKYPGCERTSNQRSNCAVRGLRIPIRNGMKLKMLTTD